MQDSHELNSPSCYPPSQTALLLLDYHNHIVSMVNPSEKQEHLLSSVKQLVNAARSNSVPTLHCLIDFNSDPPPTSKLKQRWENSLKPAIESNPEAAKVHPDLASSGEFGVDETTFVKALGCVSAMKSKTLLHILREKHQVKSLVICGLVTSGAVISTAREAADLGFVTTVVEDGCWDYSPDSHRVIMENVLPMTAWVVNLADGLKLLKSAS